MALTIDDLATIMAAQTIMNTSTMTQPTQAPQIATVVPYTNNSALNAFTVFSQPIAGSYGARLASVSVAVDAVFQSNFKWLLQVASVTSAGISYQSFDPTVNTFEDVPSGTFFLVGPGSTVVIKAFNNNPSNTNNGIMSVNLTYDQLSATQASAIKRYNQLLKYIAGLPPIGSMMPPISQTTIEVQAGANIPQVSDTFIE